MSEDNTKLGFSYSVALHLGVTIAAIVSVFVSSLWQKDEIEPPKPFELVEPPPEQPLQENPQPEPAPQITQPKVEDLDPLDPLDLPEPQPEPEPAPQKPSRNPNQSLRPNLNLPRSQSRNPSLRPKSLLRRFYKRKPKDEPPNADQNNHTQECSCSKDRGGDNSHPENSLGKNRKPAKQRCFGQRKAGIFAADTFHGKTQLGRAGINCGNDVLRPHSI